MTLSYNKGLERDEKDALVYRCSRSWVSCTVTLQRKIRDCSQSGEVVAYERWSHMGVRLANYGRFTAGQNADEEPYTAGFNGRNTLQ